MKTLNGLAVASIKTINGLAIASVKTVNGLALSAAPPAGGLVLTFADITNITAEVGDVSDVADWNTFFSLPANGTEFTSVDVSGNVVTLYGGGGITLGTYLFVEYYPYYDSDLVSIVDNDGVITSVLQDCFNLCITLTTITLNAVTTVGNGTLQGCTYLTAISLSACTALGTTTGNNTIFDSITGSTISLIVPSALMTCDGGNPDGDIVYLQANNTVTVTTV